MIRVSRDTTLTVRDTSFQALVQRRKQHVQVEGLVAVRHYLVHVLDEAPGRRHLADPVEHQELEPVSGQFLEHLVQQRRQRGAEVLPDRRRQAAREPGFLQVDVPQVGQVAQFQGQIPGLERVSSRTSRRSSPRLPDR